MIILRLTTAETFDKVLAKLRQDPLFSEEANALFLKYSVDGLKEHLINGDEECYLKISWVSDSVTCKPTMVLSYVCRSNILTDVDLLNDKD